MAELILRNHTLLSVLPRFGMPLGFGEKSIEKMCQEKNIDTNFFIMVCNIHSFTDYKPKEQELADTNIRSVVEYLQKSHEYYTKTGLEVIEQKIEKLAECCEQKHHKMLGKFYAEYKAEILKHFTEEEKILFPYIKQLIEGNRIQEKLNIQQYEKNHQNIDDKLNDIKNIILKYLPEGCSSELRNQLLFDLFIFEDDLERHTKIEERILTPLVRKIEKNNGK